VFPSKAVSQKSSNFLDFFLFFVPENKPPMPIFLKSVPLPGQAEVEIGGLTGLAK